MYRPAAFTILSCFALTATAGPPIGGFPTSLETVALACKFRNMVYLAKVVKLKEEQRVIKINDVDHEGVSQTVDLQVVEMFKGNRSDVQATKTHFQLNPPIPDSQVMILRDQATYMIIDNAIAFPVEDRDARLVPLARTLCRD
jgi:hypothetical protein